MDAPMHARLAALCLLFNAPAIAADVAVVSNGEMAAIFRADQSDRDIRPIDWKVVGAADKTRRERTKKLLDSGALRTGEDFYRAAFIFQHGDTPEDFLKAHSLGMAASAKGQPDAPWIAAATLDRYLQAIGKPQVFGTQFTRTAEGKFTQEPYDRAIASDIVREAIQVPSVAEQEAQRQKYEARSSSSAKPSK
jgi:hypothetical protein